MLPANGNRVTAHPLIAGVDEAGRGPWAGPVVAAAVILPEHHTITGLADSKTLSAAQREACFAQIMAQAQVGIGEASVEEIDTLNILAATMLAMRRAVAALPITPQWARVDGNRDPQLGIPTETIVKGDAKHAEISAASIIAKVTRDRIMQALHHEYPHYGWQKNAGYGTAAHQQGIAAVGITPHHRLSFRPIREAIAATKSKAA